MRREEEWEPYCMWHSCHFNDRLVIFLCVQSITYRDDAFPLIQLLYFKKCKFCKNADMHKSYEAE